MECEREEARKRAHAFQDSVRLRASEFATDRFSQLLWIAGSRRSMGSQK